MPTPFPSSGLRDNHTRGTVADFLKGTIQDGSRLSVVSAYFTIYAYDALKGILGSSNFTVRGLGLGAANNNIELNLIVDGNRDRQELKQWFDELWGNEALVKDVKKEVLEYPKAKPYSRGPACGGAHAPAS